MRLALALCGFLGAFFAPWWVPLACMILLALRYSAWEVPAIGLLIDLLWLSGGPGLSLPLFTMGGIFMVWVFAPLRDQFLTP